MPFKRRNGNQKGEKSVDLSQLIKLLRRDATKEAGFLAKPVELKQTSFYHIPTYGSQSAPFYLALCIWVGALLLGAILITEYQLPESLAHATVKQMYTARWLTFAGLGMLQGLIAALGNLFLIGTYVVDKAAVFAVCDVAKPSLRLNSIHVDFPVRQYR